MPPTRATRAQTHNIYSYTMILIDEAGGRNDAAAAGKFTAEIKAFVASGEQEKAFPLMPIDSMVFGSAPHVNASTSESRC